MSFLISGMETIVRSQASKGGKTFLILSIVSIVLQAAAICLMVFSWGRDLLLDSVWVHLLGLVVGMLGTSRGSVPVWYLFIFFLAVGVIQNIMMILAMSPGINISLILAVTIVLVASMLSSFATGAYVVSSKGFSSWFQFQQAKYFGKKVRVADSISSQNEGIEPKSAKSDLPAVVNDELGVFEED